MVEKIWNDHNTVQENSGQPQIAITKDWARNLNMTIGTPITRAVLKSKHGLLWAAWPENQTQPKELEDMILEATEGKK